MQNQVYSACKFFPIDPFLDRRSAEPPQLANVDAANQAAPRVSLESLGMNADDGSRFLAVDQAFRNLRSRRMFWRSERIPVGSGLWTHSRTSCHYAERQALPRAPFRYPAPDDAVLSNNFLEVGYDQME